MIQKPSSATRGPGRPREFDIDDALDGAIAVFSARGYAGTSIKDLVTAMKVTPGSLYKAFPDKRAIFVGAFERYLALRHAKIAQRSRKGQSGYEQIKAILTLYAEYSHGVQGRQGCLVIGSAVELSAVDADVAARVAKTFERYEQRFESLIRTGQSDGSISANVSSEAIARLLLCITQGMRVLGKTGRSAKEMMQTVQSALQLLK